jgi:hypothetical protein
MRADEKSAREEVEKRLVRMNKCFVEQILPGIFEVESDLSRAGYWNEVKVGRDTSSSSGKPNIKEVRFCFFPEKNARLSYHPDAGKRAYCADIKASGDLRKVNLSIRFPQRLAPLAEVDDFILPVERIDKSAVNDFLEKFVKGAIEAYSSDRLLR